MHGDGGQRERGVHGHRLAHCRNAPLGAGYTLIEVATPVSYRVIERGLMACAAKPQVVRSRPGKRRGK
jgi:hypothetical protein